MKNKLIITINLCLLITASLFFPQIHSSASDLSISDNYTVKSILANYKDINEFEKVFDPADATDSQYLLKMPNGEGGWLLQKKNDYSVAGYIYHGKKVTKLTPAKDPNAATIKQIKEALLSRNSQ